MERMAIPGISWRPLRMTTGLHGSSLPSPFPISGCSDVNLFAKIFLRIQMVFFLIRMFSPNFTYLSFTPFSFGSPHVVYYCCPGCFPYKTLVACFACLSLCLFASCFQGIPSGEGFSSQWFLPWDLWIFWVNPSMLR